MGIQFEIIYDQNPHGIFFAGQMVRGLATVILDEPTPVKSVKLRIRGYTEVRWDETESTTNSDGSTSTKTDTHSDEEQYFDTTTECIETKGLEYLLEVGTHTYTFECLTPEYCPSSFEGCYGRIRYETKITLVRPRKFNKSYSLGFSIVKVLDLNYFSDLMIPVKMEILKTFCCGPCASRPLLLSMNILESGYVPGEFITIGAALINHSNVQVEQLIISLNLIAHYFVRHRITTKTEKIPIATSKFGGFSKSTIEVSDKIQVPPTPPSCENLCPILKIKYEVEVCAKVKGAHISPVVTIPVIIGNIPHAKKSVQISADALIERLKNLTMTSSNEPPPPSYKEAIFEQSIHSAIPQKDDENTVTEFEKYSPKYLFYNV